MTHPGRVTPRGGNHSLGSNHLIGDCFLARRIVITPYQEGVDSARATSSKTYPNHGRMSMPHEAFIACSIGFHGRIFFRINALDYPRWRRQ